jgi:hypothetical protein
MNDIEKDIWDWMINYIEAPHVFYNYKFPPCPYARSARLKGLLNIKAYDGSGIFNFVHNTVESHSTNDKHTVCIMVFPNYLRWNWVFTWYLQRKNKSMIPNDYYIQYGKAITTKSKFSGLGKNSPYFIVVVNKLSDVLSAHKELLEKSEYYSKWSDFHYYDVVERRNQMFEKYKK